MMTKKTDIRITPIGHSPCGYSVYMETYEKNRVLDSVILNPESFADEVYLSSVEDVLRDIGTNPRAYYPFEIRQIDGDLLHKNNNEMSYSKTLEIHGDPKYGSLVIRKITADRVKNSHGIYKTEITISNGNISITPSPTSKRNVREKAYKELSRSLLSGAMQTALRIPIDSNQ